MATPEFSTIAQLLYPDVQAIDFARIVAELDTVLLRLHGGEIAIAWDCDDLVTFDVPGTRILLAHAETGKRGLGGCLTVSVGPSPIVADRSVRSEHEVLCSRLVERIQGRFQPDGVLWHQVAGPVGSDLVDDLIDDLPDVLTPTLPPIDSILDALSRADLQMAELKSKAPHPRSIRAPELSRLAMEPAAGEDEAPLVAGPAPTRPVVVPKRLIVIPEDLQARMAARSFDIGFDAVSNDAPDLPRPLDVELVRTRGALYPPPKAQAAPQAVYSTQMRLAAHCLNATLIVVYAPLGAAVMTYSLLRGEDMRFSGRMMAVAGTLFALAHSPVGETMAAMAMGVA